MPAPDLTAKAGSLWTCAIIATLIAGILTPSLANPLIGSAPAQGAPGIISITYSGTFSVATSMSATEGYGGAYDITLEEARQCTFTSSFASLTLVGMMVNGTETLAGVGDAAFSASQSWSLTPHPAADLQVSLNPASESPLWSSTGSVFGVLNGSRAFFLFVPMGLPQLIQTVMTVSHTQAPSQGPDIIPLLVVPPAMDAYGASLYATVGSEVEDLASDPSALLAYILEHGQLSTSNPTQDQDIPFSGEMPSSGSFGAEASVDYSGDLALKVMSVQYAATTTTTVSSKTYTLNLKSGVGGTTSPPTGNYTQASGTFLMVTANPDPSQQFSYWLLDGRDVGGANPYSVPFNADHELRPVFGSGTTTQAGRGVALGVGTWAEYSVHLDTGGSELPEGLPDFANVVSKERGY